MSLATAKWAMNTALAMAEELRKLLLPRVPINDGPHHWAWGPEWIRPGPDP